MVTSWPPSLPKQRVVIIVENGDLHAPPPSPLPARPSRIDRARQYRTAPACPRHARRGRGFIRPSGYDPGFGLGFGFATAGTAASDLCFAAACSDMQALYALLSWFM